MVIKSKGVGISNEKQGRPRIIPHPDLSYLFLSVSLLIAASIHLSQSTWALKTCLQWSLYHQTKTLLDVPFHIHRVMAKI